MTRATSQAAISQTKSSSDTTTTLVVSTPVTSPTQSRGPTIVTAGSRGSHLPVAAVAGLVVGALVVLTMLCLGVLFVRRRRILRRNAPRPPGPHPEAARLEQGVDTRPDPLILYEKSMNPADGVSSATPNSRSSSALPAAAELTLVTMAEEMRFLRGQVQRLEIDRQGGTVAAEEQPPAYETT
ncbi:hypothetical protein DFH09DRAFT_1070427 [Mycena vulgaris]|nr:hypothetical protein DFH09DRAFT_1070427 [Mycena vulgaris]